MSTKLRKFSISLIRQEEPVIICRVEGDSLVEVLSKFPMTVADLQDKMHKEDLERRVLEMKDDEIPF